MELDVALEGSGISADGKPKPLGGSTVESILVVCVDSRRALMVELALKQFSTRTETPNYMRG